MLHVFSVNRGNMMTFEVNLAMERVLELKNAIAESHGIAAEKQVMLIGSGQALCDDERVCSYAAGTETNPVYVFDKACIEKENLHIGSTYQEGSDFVESIRNARSLAPSYKTVDVRTKLAMRLHDATRHQVQQMQGLVHDEHLMFQGWQAAVANLADTVAGFQKRVEAMCTQCEILCQQGRDNEKVLDGMDTVLQSLGQIPVLPALLKSAKLNFGTNTESFQVSLLHWIKAQCKNVSVQAMLNDCRQKREFLSKERFASLLDECKKLDSQAANTRMSEISGINERLAALDHLILAAEQQWKEQTGIAQGFVRNRETARELHNNSPSIDALLTLCESHIQQLQIMSENETMTRDALHKCTHAKNELAANLHTRLRWLYFVQRSILNADVKLSMFVQQLNLMQRQVEFLDQVKQCPTLYLSSLAEVVRRKHFANLYVQWANKAVAEARVERDREIVKRKTFQSNIAGHFIQKLFHGLADKPPSLSKKPLRNFDNNLPDITPEQLSSLSQMLPDYRDLLEASCAETSSITSMTLTQSSTMMSPTISASDMQSVQHMDASVGSPPNLRSSSMETSAKDRQQSSTGSFAMVDPATITQTQPGGFVVTSVENVKQANLDGTPRNVLKKSRSLNDHNLPRRAFSSTTLTSDQQSPPSSPPDTSDAVFPQIGDIISPDSPPDSEFFSIMPGSFESNRTMRERMDTQRSTPRSSLAQDFSGSFDSPDGKALMSSRKFSGGHVGSLDSNSSTSYQKVDGLSSDEEMFHSFTSDQQDVKSLRKKLHQLQTDYDNLSEEARLEKDDLNVLVRKLKSELSSVNDNQRVMESEFEKRWGESKSELDNVIQQLENERLERKKAWTEGAKLEKKLKTMADEYHARQVHMENLEGELVAKNDAIQKLENAFRDSEASAASALAEAEGKLDEMARDNGNEVHIYKSVSTKLEKEISLAQTELSVAEDRIQELETMLSDHERKQQEDTVKFQTYEAQIHELSTQLSAARESHQQSSTETSDALQEVSKIEQKLSKANEQIFSLKKLLADYETKLDDDKKKDSVLKNLRASLHQIELEKLDVASDLASSRKESENLKARLEESENNNQSLKSIAMQDAASHQVEIEKLRSASLEELESLSLKHEQGVRILNDKHECKIRELIQGNINAMMQKEEEWKTKEEELRSCHRNEIDELEADRLASIAALQQAVEELREKSRASSRIFEQERKDVLSAKETMFENYRRLEEEHARALQDNENLSAARSELEECLLKAQEEIRSLQEIEKQDVAISTNLLVESTLTSSTDDEMESKRSKIDSGISDEMMDSAQSMFADSGRRSMSIEEHRKAIEIMRQNFEKDKKDLTNYFKRREEKAAKRRQMTFNSAIQRATSTKDIEIGKLREQVMAQSQISNPGLTRSMMVPSPQPMAMSMTQSPVSLPSPPSFTRIQQSQSVRSNSPQESSASRSNSPRDRDRAVVTN